MQAKKKIGELITKEMTRQGLDSTELAARIKKRRGKMARFTIERAQLGANMEVDTAEAILNELGHTLEPVPMKGKAARI